MSCWRKIRNSLKKIDNFSDVPIILWNGEENICTHWCSQKDEKLSQIQDSRRHSSGNGFAGYILDMLFAQNLHFPTLNSNDEIGNSRTYITSRPSRTYSNLGVTRALFFHSNGEWNVWRRMVCIWEAFTFENRTNLLTDPKMKRQYHYSVTMSQTIDSIG